MKITNLNKSFNNKIIFKNASFDFENKKITYIMGESGIGKTTLLRIISGLDTDFTGDLDATGRISYVFQEPRLFPSLTLIENIKIVNESSSKDPNELLDLVELNGCANMYPHELSGGMKARASIARALYFGADLILMDEPFASIDTEMKNRIAKRIFSLLSEKTVIVVSHDENEAKEFADKILKI